MTKPFARMRYVLGKCVRLVSQPWLQENVEPALATTIFGCSFSDTGWHHICQTLAELDFNPHLRAADSTLAHFLSDFCPTSISKLAGVEDEEPLPLFIYPWGTFTDGTTTTSKNPAQSRFCGPSNEQFIADEFSRTVALYRQMLVTGYTPLKFPNSFITGTWLEALNGERRFVVMQGNHRMAVLAHMGTPQVAVRTSRASLSRVRECELESWPLVVSGRCSINHARKIFHLFFKQNGWHVAASLGLKYGQ
jgi:hypothetical protein